MRYLSRIRNAAARHRAVTITVAVLVGGAVVAAVLAGGVGSSRHHPGTTTTPPSATTTTPLPPQPPPTTEQFGANTGRLFNDRTYGAGQIDSQLAALRDTGATLARSDAFWEATEPVAPSAGVHHYDWSFDDSIAAALAAHGLRWLPIIDYSAPWAQSSPGHDHSAPAPPEAYASYAAAVAARYGPGGSFWSAHPQLQQEAVDTYEIWNEPDNPIFWSPAPDAAAYAELYLRARAAIDAAQPHARVIVGGLTRPASFIPAMLTAVPSLANQLDGVAVHPYGATPQAVLEKVRAARTALDVPGLSRVPLYVTEFGWTTSPPGALDYLPERLRPSYIELTLAALGHLDCGVAAAALYAWVTPERSPTNDQDWFGIHPPDGGSSPDTVALGRGLRAAAGSAPAIRLCSGG